MTGQPDSQTLESMSQAVWYNQWTLNKFKAYLKGKILEVGCGTGNFSTHLAKYGNLTAVDINQDYVKQAKKKVENGEVGIGDIEKDQYFFGNKKFNTIVCLNVLEHIKNDDQAIKNIHALLTKDGFLILLVPAHQFLYNLIDKSIGHFRRYEKKQLKSLLHNNDFEIVKLRTLNFLGSIGWFIAGKLLRNNKVGEVKIRIFNIISPFFLLLENLFEPPIGTSILIIARKKKL